MADISAFRGIRYDLGHVGSLSNVVAPPYDVIDAELQQRLYKQHPANVVRLILNKDEPGDDEHNNRYTRAARLYRQWRRDGVLFTESDPAIYVYHQVFTEAGTTYTRRGFMGRVRLERFGEGNIYPHEETHGSCEGGPAETLDRVPGEPQPDLWPVPRPGERSAEHSRSGDRGRRAARGDRPSGRRSSHLARDRRGDDHGGRAARWAAGRCTSPTGITATKRPAPPRSIGRRRTAVRCRPNTRRTSC